MTIDRGKKIEELRQKLAQLQAADRAAAARARSAEVAKIRAADTRKKILLGSFLLAQLGEDGVSKLNIQGMRLGEWLQRPQDLLLFGLPPPPPPSPSTPSNSGGGG